MIFFCAHVPVSFFFTLKDPEQALDEQGSPAWLIANSLVNSYRRSLSEGDFYTKKKYRHVMNKLLTIDNRPRNQRLYAMDAEKTEIKTFYTFAFCNSLCSVYHCTIARVLIPFVLYNGEFFHHQNWTHSGLPRIPLTQLTTQNGDYEAFIPNDSSTAYFGVQFNGQHIDYDALYRGPRVKGKFLEFKKRKEIEAAMVQNASYFPNKTPRETKGFAEKIAGFILERARDGVELSKVLRVIQSQWRRDVMSAPIHLTSKVDIGDGDTFVPNNGYNWDQAHKPERNPADFDPECTDTVRIVVACVQAAVEFMFLLYILSTFPM